MVNSIGQCFMSLRNEIEKNVNQTYFNKRSRTHVYGRITYAWFCIKEETYEHLAHTSQIQQDIVSFKVNASISVLNQCLL